VDRPGKFQFAAEIASLGAGKFEIVLGDQKISGTAPNTGDYTKFRHINLSGVLDISAPGKVTIAVKPVAGGWQPINLKSLTLKPAAN
jgi:alpha-L-fucosidase